MGSGRLTIDLGAIANNWQALADRCTTRMAAVLKADAYGLGAAHVAPVLADAGARQFFVATTGEAVELRAILGPDMEIFVLSGPLPGDIPDLIAADLIPVLNSTGQISAYLAHMAGHACAIQLDSGMNRLGLEPADLPQIMLQIPQLRPKLVMSHLACGDIPTHPFNATQLAAFQTMRAAFPGVPGSLAATSGILLGPGFHLDLTRPGIGVYGGRPFENAQPVVQLDLPVIQTRSVLAGEIVGYGATWQARRLSRIATVSAGYADGLLRGLKGAVLHAGDQACPVVGRISMDLITVDVTDLDADPTHLTVLGPHQGIDRLAEAADTIGYEILTSLGRRYSRTYEPAGRPG